VTAGVAHRLAAVAGTLGRLDRDRPIRDAHASGFDAAKQSINRRQAVGLIPRNSIGDLPCPLVELIFEFEA